MSTMRRTLLHRQGQFLYFLFLILCKPVIIKDDLPNHQEKWKFFCRQSGGWGNSPPSFILESFIAKDSSSSPSPAEPNQTLSKTLWALRVDKEVWHGDLIDTWQGELASNAFEPQEVSNPLSPFLNSAAGREGKDGKGMLVMHCNSRLLGTESTGDNLSTSVKCLKRSQQQSSINTIADETLLNIMQVVIRPSRNVFHEKAFQLHDQCSWSHEGYASSAALSFLDNNKAVQTLELNFNSSLFPSLQHKTLKELVNRLLDERNTRYACNQGSSRELIAKNMQNLPLQVHSLLIKGGNGEMHGFKVQHFSDFYLGPGETTRLHVSYQPDFKTGITDGELQLVTSAGVFSVTLKANVPKHIQSLCQNAAVMARAKKIMLTVFSLALFIVLLVFGRMLQQEGLIMPNTSQWSTERNATRLSPRDSERSMQYLDDKKSSIYVSIDIGCTRGLSLTKALHVVYAAINCIVGFKFLYISHASNTPQVQNITNKSDLHTPHNYAIRSPTSSMTGKSRASTHLQACSKPASTSFNGGALLKTKACSMKKTVSHTDVTEPESPAAAHSDKENEKPKQKKKKKGASSLAPGMETRSDSGSSSPLSMPSSPVIHKVLCRPVSPSTFGARAPIHKCEAPVEMDAVMLLSEKNGHNLFQKHCSTDGYCSLQKTKIEFNSEDSEANNLHASHARTFPKSINQGGRSSEAKSVVKPSERNLVKVATVRNNSKGIVTIGATLTTSATFPAPGQRSWQESILGVDEGGQNRSVIWSSSSSDLVSTSIMAPHARAPGSPLSPKSPSYSGDTLSSSPLTAPRSSRQHLQQGSQMCRNRNGHRADFKGKAPHKHEIFYNNAYGRSNPRQMHGPHYAQRRQDSRHGSDSVILYDIWGDHFADLGRRWGPCWIGKDAPIARKPSSLPPLLQTPPFSVFSSNDPFSR